MSDVSPLVQQQQTTLLEHCLQSASDPEALGRLLESYRGSLHRIAFNRLSRTMSRRLDPADVVQEVFVSALRDFPHFRGQTTAELSAWLKKILLNKLSSLVSRHHKMKRDIRRDTSLEELANGRRSQMLRHDDERCDRPDTFVDRQEQKQLVQRALTNLPSRYAAVIRLRNFERASYESIRVQLGVSESCARVLHIRALRLLKKRLTSTFPVSVE